MVGQSNRLLTVLVVVTGLSQRPDGSWDVATDKGSIHAEHVVNAGGLWAREIGRMVGIELPVLAMEHHYIVTEAIPTGLRSRVPAKMTSSMRAPRRLFADCSPSTQLIASLRFDLPQPFGPTIAAMPAPLKRISVRSTKDLNPWISTRFSLSNGPLLFFQLPPGRYRPR